MAEWLYEAGIGEERAALVEEGEILEALIELPGEIRVGAIVEGRLADILAGGRRGMVTTLKHWIAVDPLPTGLTKGQRVRVEVVRAPIAEPGHAKVAKGRITEEPERDGPDLAQRIGPHRPVSAFGPDRLEVAGWSSMLEEAVSGEIGFDGGDLRMSLTPAMTLFDVDGALDPADLAVRGAEATARAVRRLGIGGSIGIDLPTVPAKAQRQQAAAAVDRILPQPFERTAVNGFGFLQIVRRRERESLAELLQYRPVAAAARALLRKAERYPGVGTRLLVGSSEVIRLLERETGWIMELERRIGCSVQLRPHPTATTWSIDVHASQS